MSEAATVVVTFKDLEHDDTHEELREEVERHCAELAREFPETTRFEITVSAEGVGYLAHAHVSGKSTQVATHASATDLRPATDLLLDRIRTQLRKIHDKRIFQRRREAQKSNPKRPE